MSGSVGSTTEDVEAAALKVVISASLALAVMMADFVWLIRDEVKLIWRLRFWNARVYLIFRYTGLTAQIFNVYFTVRMYAGIATTPTGCQLWFSYQAFTIQILLASVERALMHRVYVLFRRNQYILMVLVTLAAGQIASMGISESLSVPSNHHTATCMVFKSSPGSAYFGATTLTTSILIFFMTFCGFLRLPVRWNRLSIARVMMRDTSLSLLSTSCWMLFLTLCSLEVIQPSLSANIIFYWLVCILWMSIGRIVMNQQALADEEYKSTVIQLTSLIEVGECTSWGASVGENA